MRSLLIRMFLPGLFMVYMTACTNDRRKIEKCVEDEMKLHPAAHLVDLYKYFTQDAFGPGHMINDREEAEKYLNNELSVASTFEPFDYQELNFKNQFIRVNLRMIVDGGISKEVLLDAFMQSAKEFKLPDVDKWRMEWAGIAEVITRLRPGLPDLDRELAAIDSMLRTGNYAVHHSRDYIRSYDPHYRIIHRNFFKTCLSEGK